MTKTKIALYLALIFLAGAVAGAGIHSMIPRSSGRQRPPHNPDPEAFAKHIFNRIKERLDLKDEQIEKVEPVFRKGFAEVRAIQERSVKEVEAALKRNHDEIAKFITPEQREKLDEMDKEREKAMRERRGRHFGPGGPPPGHGPGLPAPNSKPEGSPQKN
jgi:Spy/CpxP family protein refolding chaperone